MATPFENLEAEVRKLKREIKRLKGDPSANQAVVNELVGTADEPKGFHAACERSGAIAIAEQRRKLISRLNGSALITPHDVLILRQDFSAVHDLEQLLSARISGSRVE